MLTRSQQLGLLILLVAFIIFKVVIGHRMQSTPRDQAAALS